MSDNQLKECLTLKEQCNNTRPDTTNLLPNNNNNNNENTSPDISNSDENMVTCCSMEKCDITPENSRKSVDVTPDDDLSCLDSISISLSSNIKDKKLDEFVDGKYHDRIKNDVTMDTRKLDINSKQMLGNNSKINNEFQSTASEINLNCNKDYEQILKNVKQINDLKLPEVDNKEKVINNRVQYTSNENNSLNSTLEPQHVINRAEQIDTKMQDNRLTESLHIEEIDENNKISPDSPKQQALSFTIDFNEGRAIDSQRYKNMVEKFQNRHKRGVSLSKLDDNHNSKLTSSTSIGNIKNRQPMSAKLPRKTLVSTTPDSSISSDHDEINRIQPVKLRDKKLVKAKDNSKRHSWSPRTSQYDTNSNQVNVQYSNPAPSTIVNKSSIPKPAVQINTEVRHRFTPRSTVMAMALDATRKVTADVTLDINLDTIPCIAPPLENIRGSDDESVSEAGTYTLDGDNYTEEQKEKMNIDKLLASKCDAAKLKENAGVANDNSFLIKQNYKSTNLESIETRHSTSFEDELEIIDLDEENQDDIVNEKRRKNVLEISFCHESTSNVKPKISYLEKIKSRVKNIGERTFHKSKSPDFLNLSSPDVGTFTSVTTSGILSYKPILDCNPKLRRRNSLTKAQIDSSEYVQGVSRLNLTNNDNEEKILNCYTDVEKANLTEYNKINLQSPTTSYDSTNNLGMQNEFNYDDSNNTSNDEILETSIKTVATKSDWIHEWAKNAREFSRNSNSNNNSGNSSAKKTNNSIKKMSRSYDFHNNNINEDNNYDIMTKSDYYDKNYEEFGDNLQKPLNYNNKNKIINKNNNNTILKNYEYSSDSNLRYNQGRLEQRHGVNASGDIGCNTQEFVNSNIGHMTDLHKRGKRSGFNMDYYGAGEGQHNEINNEHIMARPPMSPSKIPSPCHTMGRARSISRNRSLQGSSTDLTSHDTEMYLQKTAAAISTLQNLHRKNSMHNSPNSSSPGASPTHKTNNKLLSPKHIRSPLKERSLDNYNTIDNNEQYKNMSRIQLLHKRNLSLDGSEIHPKFNNNYISQQQYLQHQQQQQLMNTYNYDNYNKIIDNKKQHTRHNSFDGMQKPLPSTKQMQCIDQTSVTLVNVRPREKDHETIRPAISTKQNSANRTPVDVMTGGHISKKSLQSSINTKPLQNSPIKRSSSFSVKPMTFTPKMAPKINKGSSIQKSASSTSFKKMMTNVGDDDMNEFYINDDDDLNPNPGFSSDSDYSVDHEVEKDVTPITNTRCNKTLLMRIEQSRKPSQNTVNTKHGVMACPNTPELPRRDTTVRASLRSRASMPRESSLTRMKQDMSNFNNSKKTLSKESICQQQQQQQQQQHLLEKQQQQQQLKILPKYMDISKYKPVQGQNFLKKDESKSYLASKETVRRSPSSASVNLNRQDPTRYSNRSIKSAGAKPNINKKDVLNSVAAKNKEIKETELAMWRRRASYDPMKAAAEGRKKQEEARRHQHQQQSKLNESSIVLRSQSFHSGVSNEAVGASCYNYNINNKLMRGNEDEGANFNYNNNNSKMKKHNLTIQSTESSDNEDDYDDDEDDEDDETYYNNFTKNS